MTLARDETLKSRLPAPTNGRMPVDVGGVTIKLDDGDLHVESDAVTNAQLRAAPVTVDTELPPATVPGSEDTNSAAPAVVARLQALNGATGKWRAPSTSRADGSAIQPPDTLAVVPHIVDADSLARPPRTARALDDNQDGRSFAGVGNMVHNVGTNQWARMRQAGDSIANDGVPAAGTSLWTGINWARWRSASALGDAETGGAFGGSGQMLHNGTTWQRARAPTREVILASSPRVAPADPGMFAAPALTNRGFRAVLLWLTITEAPASTAGGLTMKVTGPGGTSVLTQAGISAPGDLVRTTGTYYWVLGATITNGGVRPAGIPTSIPAGTLESPVASSSVPLPAVFTPQVWHRSSAGESWTYSLSIDWCL